MQISKRPAKVGNQIPSRGEMHGDESVTALDIPLLDVMLDEHELGELMGEPRAAAALFDHSQDKRLPFFTNIKPLVLTEKIEGARVTITHGIGQDSIHLVNVKVAKIKLQPCVGGMTAMDCTIQCTPDLDANVANLLGWINAPVDVEIDGGQFGAQEELPIDPPPSASDELSTRRSRRAQ